MEAIKILAEYLDREYFGEVFAEATYGKGEILQQPSELNDCVQLGRNCIQSIASQNSSEKK